MARRFSPAELTAHADGVRALAKSLLGDASAADDLVQDACLAALQRPPADDTPSRPWFVAVVRNLARRAQRTGARRGRRERAAARPEPAPSAADVAAQIETHRSLVDAVASLDEPYRTAIVLRYFDGLTPAEIGARLGIPAATAATHVHRGLATLRARFERDRDDWRAGLLLVVATGDVPRVPPLVPVAGAIAMTGKKIVLLAVALLLVVGGGFAVHRLASQPERERRAAIDVASPRQSGERVKSPAPAADAPPSDDASLPPPVDLDKCNRDLDLHGVVVTVDGRPVAGASIATITSPWRDAGTFNYDAFATEVRGVSTRSASDGTFSLRLARGDAVTLRVSASGFTSREFPLRQAGERLRIVLDAGVRLTVTIRDAAGGPLADVPLRVLREHEGDETFRRDATTGADGRGVIEGLPGGVTAYVAQGVRPRFALPVTRVALPASGEATVEIVAKGECRALTGRVLDEETGHAIDGARVGLGENLRVQTASDADGSFVLNGWSGDADAEVHVLADGHARAVAFAGDGGTLEFRLKGDASAAGRVVGGDGAPIADAMVSIASFRMNERPWGFSAGYATSGVDGRFRIAGLARDTAHTLVVEARGRARLLRKVAPSPGGEDLGDIVLAAPRAIEGRVLAGDFPIERARVTLMAMDSGWTSSRGATNRERYTDDLGRFRFRDLAPGRYTVIVDRRGAPGATTGVDLPPERDILELTLGVPATRDVVVRVTDEKGGPVAGIWVRVTAIPAQGSPSINARTDEAGAARVAVPAGDARVEAIPSPSEARAFVAAGPRPLGASESEVVIVLRDAVHTTGRVVDPEGAPVAHAPIAIVQAGGRSTQVTSDAEGRFDAVVAPDGVLALSFDGLISPDRGPSATDTGIRGRLAGVAPGSRDVVLRCERVANDRTLRVLVVAPDGTPVPAASFWYASNAEAGGELKFAQTGPDGRARLAGLTPDEVTLATMIRGDWFASATVRAKPDGGEVTLAYRTAVVISGTVMWPDGRVPKECEASLRRGERAVVSNAADAAGRFRLLAPADEPGPYVVVVTGIDEKGRFEGRSAEVSGAAVDVRVTLDRK